MGAPMLGKANLGVKGGGGNDNLGKGLSFGAIKTFPSYLCSECGAGGVEGEDFGLPGGLPASAGSSTEGSSLQPG